MKYLPKYDLNDMTKAYMKVKEENMSIRKAAKLFNVPKSTLYDRVNGITSLEMMGPGKRPLFSKEQEARLADHINTLANVGYEYIRPELCNFATEYAIDLGLRDKEQPLTVHWYNSFVGRWPNIAVKKKARSLCNARANATSLEKVTAYFKELKSILDEYDLKEKPQHVYNFDEKQLSVYKDSPSKVTAHRTNSAVPDKDTVTILGAGNAVGTAIPPYFIFPGQKMRSELLKGASTGANGTVSKTGLCNGKVLKLYLETHFVKFAQGRSPSEPVLLLYNGHCTYISVGIIDWAKQENIILFPMPSYTCRMLKPLDVGCFGSFPEIYNNLLDNFASESSSSSNSKLSICELGCKAYSMSLSATNLCSSFSNCGIYPLNSEAVSSITFVRIHGSKARNSSEKGDETEAVNAPSSDVEFDATETEIVTDIDYFGTDAYMLMKIAD